MPERTMDVGTGIRFPNMFSLATKRTAVLDGVDKINQSIHDILSTRKGERVLQPEYGSDLYRVIFDPNDDFLADQLAIYTLQALEHWEPRIEITNVDIKTHQSYPDEVPPHTAYIYISYLISKSNIKASYVYPYRTEPRDFPGLE